MTLGAFAEKYHCTSWECLPKLTQPEIINSHFLREIRYDFLDGRKVTVAHESELFARSVRIATTCSRSVHLVCQDDITGLERKHATAVPGLMIPVIPGRLATVTVLHLLNPIWLQRLNIQSKLDQNRDFFHLMPFHAKITPCT